MLNKIVVLFQLQTSESFTVYVINVNVPRVRANADKCLQHHQGCPETPKSADVICEWPLIKVVISECEFQEELEPRQTSLIGLFLALGPNSFSR